MIVDHRGGDNQLAAFVVVGDDGGHVGHVAAVIFEVETAGADDPAREPHAHRLDQVGELVDEEVGVHAAAATNHPRGITDAHRRDHVRCLMDEQIGEHAAAERPVTAPLAVDRAVEQDLRTERRAGENVKGVAEEHVPVDGFGIHVFGDLVIAPLAADVIAVIAGLALADVADFAVADHLVGLVPGRVGHRLHADCHDAVVLLHGIDDGVGLVDGAGHRLLAVDIFAGGGGVDGHLGMPVIGRGDADNIDFLQFQDMAVVFGDVLFIVGLEAALFRREIQAAANFFVAVPDIAHGNRLGAAVFFFELVDDVEVFLAAAADAQEADADAVVGALNAGITGGGQRKRSGPGRRRLQKVAAIDVGSRHESVPPGESGSDFGR